MLRKLYDKEIIWRRDKMVGDYIVNDEGIK